MRIIGIDPGTAIVGWGIVDVEDGRPKAVAYGHITTPAGMYIGERVLLIAEELEKILDEHVPEESAVEELFFSNNAKTAMTVSQARGAILLTLGRFGVTVSGYTPNQVKQSLTSYGRADKHQMQMMVKNILHLPDIPKPDDVADALAVAVCHSFSRKTAGLIGK
ncbi:MAG: crossover junction endodeoxyribonuclease RuvC [Candidatus Moranbacteria bacterium]|nr:crossover junction endodeoxyribonuclease RuvC [Candidatus Moranbacteria bacterium]